MAGFSGPGGEGVVIGEESDVSRSGGTTYQVGSPTLVRLEWQADIDNAVVQPQIRLYDGGLNQYYSSDILSSVNNQSDHGHLLALVPEGYYYEFLKFGSQTEYSVFVSEVSL
jgi:hypothetical protein